MWLLYINKIICFFRRNFVILELLVIILGPENVDKHENYAEILGNEKGDAVYIMLFIASVSSSNIPFDDDTYYHYNQINVKMKYSCCKDMTKVISLIEVYILI